MRALFGTMEPKVAERRQVPIAAVETPAPTSLVWTVTEAAVLLGVSRSQAYELVARRQLRYVRLGIGHSRA